MSTPLPYGPKPSQSKRPASASTSTASYNIEIKESVYNGLLMTAGILGSTFVVKKVKKDMAPQLSTNSIVALGTVTILSSCMIDYAKNNDWISHGVQLFKKL